MGLKPLEFSDCYLDTPYFRDSVYEHEKELEKTNERIKGLIKECRNLLKAIDSLSKAQKSFCTVLKDFTLNYIGEIDTADEIEIADAFSDFASLIDKVEEERARMIFHGQSRLIDPLEVFRKVHIGGAKEEKKKYDEETRKYCTLLDKHLQLKNKTKDDILKEADLQIQADFKNFQQLSFEYVSKLQEVNERKKFEFVEILLTFIYDQKTFFHNGHECYTDAASFLDGLSYKLQTIRERFDITKEEAEDLKRKVEKQGQSGELQNVMNGRQGYLFVQEKKHAGLVSAWTKYYCMYQKENKIFTMIPFTQTMGKLNTNTDTMVVTSCTRKPTEPPDRRFCFEITGMERKETITLQALSDEDRRCWLDVMEGTEPIYLQSADLINESAGLSEIGIIFVKKCISAIENKGIEEEGLYRVAGVSSKFNNLVRVAIESKKAPILDLESDQSEYDLRTITSALKQFFRNLPEPILTFKLHGAFLDAIKLDTNEKRIEAIQDCLCKIPEVNYNTLNLLMQHLVNVAKHSNRNLMQASNLGVVWGPTLMRPREETMAALMNLKYQGVVIETLIKEFDKIFTDEISKKISSELAPPDRQDVRRSPVLQRKTHGNGPIGITNPAYTVSPKPQVQQKPAPSQKSYPAPPPPALKPAYLQKKNRMSKNDDAEFEDWTIVSDSSSIGSAHSDEFPVVRKAVSSPVLNLSPESALNQKQAVSPQHRKGPKGSRPEPPPKRYVEGVTAFTSVKKIDTLEEEDQDYENIDNGLPKRTVSFEKAMQTGRKPVIDLSSVKLAPIESDNPNSGKRLDTTSPPAIPRRRDWRVRAIYNCVAENDSELSFSIGAIITNVKKSAEDGWLTGTLNGRTGLIPLNYVETIEHG